MKMEPLEGSETSASRTQTPGNYPKENMLYIDNVFNDCLTLLLRKLLSQFYCKAKFVMWDPTKKNVNIVCLTYDCDVPTF